MKPNIVRLALATRQLPAINGSAPGCLSNPSKAIAPGIGLLHKGHAKKRPTESCRTGAISLPELRSVLLISEDTALHETLRGPANSQRLIIVRVGGLAGVDEVLRLLRPCAVVLDLDLSQDAAWNLGDKLLLQHYCPPVLFLTASTERFDVRTAIQSGSIIDKTAHPLRLLQLVDQATGLTRAALAERMASQRVLLRWLRPWGWSLSIAPGHRFRRINE